MKYRINKRNQVRSLKQQELELNNHNLELKENKRRLSTKLQFLKHIIEFKNCNTCDKIKKDIETTLYKTTNPQNLTRLEPKA